MMYLPHISHNLLLGNWVQICMQVSFILNLKDLTITYSVPFLTMIFLYFWNTYQSDITSYRWIHLKFCPFSFPSFYFFYFILSLLLYFFYIYFTSYIELLFCFSYLISKSSFLFVDFLK